MVQKMLFHDSGFLSGLNMAARVDRDTRKAIIMGFARHNKTKAELSRQYGISVSSVYRILRKAGYQSNPTPAGMTPHSATKDGTARTVDQDIIQKETADTSISPFPETDAEDEQYRVREEKPDDSNLDDFTIWLNSREEREREIRRLLSEISTLKSEKLSVENELNALDRETKRMQETIDRLRSLADRALKSLSAVDSRLYRIEERMADDRDLIMISSGIRTLVERGELDPNLLSFLGDLSGIWISDDPDITNSVRRALMAYLEVTQERISLLKNIM